MLGMSKDTLRYYDKLGMVCPQRGDNRYRYYTEQDILDLQYIEVMKYGQFTLAEIRLLFRFRHSTSDNNDYSEIMQLYADKRQEFQLRIKNYRMLTSLLDQFMELKANHKESESMDAINAMVKNLFGDIREGKYEK